LSFSFLLFDYKSNANVNFYTNILLFFMFEFKTLISKMKIKKTVIDFTVLYK